MAGESASEASGVQLSLADHSPPVHLAFGLLRFARRQPLGAIGGVLVAFFIFVAVFAPLVAPYDPERIDLRRALEGPSSTYRLGTDDIGRDVLSRLIWGARLSMIVGFGAVLISGIVGTVVGVFSAYIGGWVDHVIMRLVDAWIAMPGLIILITILGIVRRTDYNLVLAMLIALAFLRIAPAARVYRSAVLELRSRPYIDAAQSLGANPVRIMVRHVLPNVFPLILITTTVALPGTILAEASLSFLGFGPAGETSWGQMLSVDGREYFRRQPGLAIYPGLLITASVFGFNMFGDALRDILDPRMRGGGR